MARVVLDKGGRREGVTGAGVEWTLFPNNNERRILRSATPNEPHRGCVIFSRPELCIFEKKCRGLERDKKNPSPCPLPPQKKSTHAVAE